MEALPSLGANPSRSTEKGLLAWAGSMSCDSVPMRPNDDTMDSSSAASVPPAMTASASSRIRIWNASSTA